MQRSIPPFTISIMIAAAVIGAGLVGCGSKDGGGSSNDAAANPGAGTTPGTGSGQLLGTTFDSATSRQLWSGLMLPSARSMRNRPEASEPEYPSTITYAMDTQRVSPA